MRAGMSVEAQASVVFDSDDNSDISSTASVSGSVTVNKGRVRLGNGTKGEGSLDVKGQVDFEQGGANAIGSLTVSGVVRRWGRGRV
jgi:hypothetical protein